MTANILTVVGIGLLKRGRPILFKAHVESVVPSAYIRKDNTEMRQLALKAWLNNKSVPRISPKKRSKLLAVQEKANDINEIQTPLKSDSF